MKSGLLREPIGVPIRMSGKHVEWRFSWDHITSFGGGLQLIDYVGKFLKLAPFRTDPVNGKRSLQFYLSCILLPMIGKIKLLIQYQLLLASNL
jgi:hypothetical protein